MPINVWTVLWVLDKPFTYRSKPKHLPQDKPEVRSYTPEDVIRFKRMVERHIPDCTFRCLSNVPIPGIERIPLLHPIDRWWSQMEVFRPDLPSPPSGRNIYFDLDSILIRDIDQIVSFPAPAAFIKPGKFVGSNRSGPWQDHEGYWRIPMYQCSIKVWDTEYGHRFWHALSEEHKARLASDQDFLAEAFPDEGRMPTEWFRKIGHAETKPSAPVKVVMAMHMGNDEAARRYPWVRQIWN